ncbi:DUF2235 domain-containing protein [Shewanella sp. 202IG2-18]|uniref:phospholipase effector Tle1 domain-containing protein n=1 Tax=Parashewanella hymeniacidonis TaxID=2807618 RepID=UPI00195FDA8C|nr:DUF2235 domain-containing protein [Parashewanella hymeniacidonis]MBM7074114.1 DUF2235 domain-containing protein [Parashewanella hymeniacidonis]
MSALIVFNFDGTGNEPEDAKSLPKDDSSISNILKLHLLMGGTLFEDADLRGISDNKNIHRCFYYQGVGTYGHRLNRIINQGLAPENLDVATILNRAKQDFKDCYKTGDTLLIIGFSRGAAITRPFATIIASQMLNKETEPCIFLCAFDTVASIGLPNLSTRSRPDYDVVFENGNTLSPLVTKALHLVSLDDKRRPFQPTLMNHEPNKTFEIWFAGSHSDIGGGFAQDGLSDITLKFVKDWLTQMSQITELPDIEFKTLTSQAIDEACPKELKGVITPKDIECKPNPFGTNHQQRRWPVIGLITMDDRECCVMQHDQIQTDMLPIIHSSVTIRLNHDKSYQPKSLELIAHSVWDNFYDSPTHFDNIKQHRESRT